MRGFMENVIMNDNFEKLQVYQHIVLLVKHDDKFGAFGISRDANLMSKDVTFSR
jgi:hypothetical protein